MLEFKPKSWLGVQFHKDSTRGLQITGNFCNFSKKIEIFGKFLKKNQILWGNLQVMLGNLSNSFEKFGEF